MPEDLALLKEELFDFCLLRQKDEGGFGATPYLPPTVEDTYFAVEILSLLKAPFPKKETSLFLRKKGRSPLSPRLAYFIKRALFLLGEKDFKPALRFSSQKDLEESYYLKLLGQKVPPVNVLPETLTVKELYFLAFIEPTEARKFVSLVLDSQNPDGGFGFYPGSTSYLENSYYAFFFLKRLRLSPRNPKKLRNFIFSCFRKGGFARSPQGIPFLESTYQALQILSSWP